MAHETIPATDASMAEVEAWLDVEEETHKEQRGSMLLSNMRRFSIQDPAENSRLIKVLEYAC